MITDLVKDEDDVDGLLAQLDSSDVLGHDIFGHQLHHDKDDADANHDDVEGW